VTVDARRATSVEALLFSQEGRVAIASERPRGSDHLGRPKAARRFLRTSVESAAVPAAGRSGGRTTRLLLRVYSAVELGRCVEKLEKTVERFDHVFCAALSFGRPFATCYGEDIHHR
jgi:hypothetical protein